MFLREKAPVKSGPPQVALFGIPLQQTWFHPSTGSFAPESFTESDTPLYYYSFTDAHIAHVYKSLDPDDQARFDPMITGFNPADKYAADHIERVLRMYPGVFTGVGEFTIHKEMVSNKVAGERATLSNPAVDRILQFCAEAGLLVILHCDIDIPYWRDQVVEPVYLHPLRELFRRNSDTTIIWAHMGLGRLVHPVEHDSESADRDLKHVRILESMIEDRDFGHVYFDISWEEVAKHVVARSDITEAFADLINRFPKRFLFGTDVVAPSDEESYFDLYHKYEPLWEKLTPDAKEKVTKGNYERLFDKAREQVRDWEEANL